MSRIAAVLLIVAAVVALNAGMLGQAFAEDQGVRIKLESIAPKGEACPAEPRGSRVMALLLCLEALRAAPQPITPKV